MLQKLRTLPVLTDVNSNQQDKGLQSTLVIDRDTASRLGLTAQRQVAITYTPLHQYHVVMEVAPPYWQHPETLRQIYVHSPRGAEVPLSAFTRYEPTTAPLSVNRLGQFPAVTISFNLARGAALGDAVAAVEAATREMGLPASIRGSFLGAAEAFKASLANEPYLILAALLAVYIVLGILYESYVHPITILSTLPSAGVGALVALMLSGTELSIITVIGIILLIGIVKKNGIMMVDFALEVERQEGKRPEEAVKAARLSVTLSTNQYQAGTISTLDLLVVVTNARNNERTAVTILGNRLSASVLLIKALGGGWNAADLPFLAQGPLGGRANTPASTSQEQRESSAGVKISEAGN